jgi:competence protein ComGC
MTLMLLIIIIAMLLVTILIIITMPDIIYEYRQPRYNKATRATINTNIESAHQVASGLF